MAHDFRTCTCKRSVPHCGLRTASTPRCNYAIAHPTRKTEGYILRGKCHCRPALRFLQTKNHTQRNNTSNLRTHGCVFGSFNWSIVIYIRGTSKCNAATAHLSRPSAPPPGPLSFTSRATNLLKLANKPYTRNSETHCVILITCLAERRQ